MQQEKEMMNFWSLSRKLEDYEIRETALNDDEVKLMYEKDHAGKFLLSQQIMENHEPGKIADGSGSPSLFSSSGKENQCS